MPDARTTASTPADALENPSVPRQRPMRDASLPDLPCPVWCTEQHGPGSLGVVGSHGAELAAVPHTVGRLETSGTCRVEAVLSTADRVVCLSTDGDRCRLTLDAAETLGRGLLAAAALLRQG